MVKFILNKTTMKKATFIISAMLLCSALRAQNYQFGYDNNGNRTSREVIEIPQGAPAPKDDKQKNETVTENNSNDENRNYVTDKNTNENTSAKTYEANLGEQTIDGKFWQPVKIHGVNLNTLKWYGKLLDKGGTFQVPWSDCVAQASRALNLSGVINIGIHPYLLQAEMYLREIGARPMLFNYYLTTNVK